MQQVKFYQHPCYAENAPEWIKYRDLREGKHNVLISPDYLWLNTFEKKKDGEEFRQIREQRTRYLNLQRTLIEIWKGIFFKREIDVDDKTKEALGDDIKNIDGEGNSLFSFLKDKILPAYLEGKVAVLVDSFTDKVKSKADEKIKGQRPFLQLVKALDLMDWKENKRSSNQFGQFDWARHEYVEIAPRVDGTTEPQQVQMCDMLVLNGNTYTIRRFRQDDSKDEKGAPNWVEMEPITPTPAKDHIPLLVLQDESWVADAAEEALRFFNLRSDYDEINHNSAYTKVFAAGLDPNNPDQIRALTTYLISLLPAGATIETIQPTDTSGVLRAMADSIDAFFKVGLRQVHALPADSREGMSAEAQGAERVNATNLVLATVDKLEGFLNSCLAEYMAFKGEANFNGRVTLSREIEFESIQSQLNIYTALADKLRKYPTWEKETLMRIAKFQNFGEEEYEAIQAEIEAGPVEDEPVISRTDMLKQKLGMGQANQDGTDDEEEADAEQPDMMGKQAAE